MFKQAFIVLFVLAWVRCEPPIPQYGVPYNNNAGYINNNVGNLGHGVNTGIKTPFTNYGTPHYDNNNNGYGHGHGGQGHDYNNANDHGEPKAYEFGYQVKDDYTGTNYNRQEQSDGNQVTGSYRVALPDGRTQIVTYYADWKTGFHADVRYEGEAQFPPPNNGGYNYNANQHYNNNQNYNAHQGFNKHQYQGYNNYNNYNNNAQNTHYVPPSNQYGAPVNPIAINNQYAALSANYGTPHTGSGYDNYNSNQNYNQPHHNYNNAGTNNYDNYANSGYGSKKPTTAYGAP